MLSGKLGVVTIEPARRITRWRLLAGTSACRVLEGSLYGYQVIGLVPRGSVVDCIRSLVESNTIRCGMDWCDALATCSSHVVGSSSIVLRCGDYVAKLYLVLPPSNPEDQVLALLSTTGTAPIIVTRLFLGDQVIGVVEERVPGEPLAEAARRELEDYLSGVEEVRVVPLAARLLARIHKTLRSWQERCALQLLARSQWYLDRLPLALSERLKPLVVEMISQVQGTDVAITDCQLVHQDPHLYQFRGTTSAMRIIDFNGEPLRAPSAPRYEPAIRDLAVLLRSAAYIAATKLVEKPMKGISEEDRYARRITEWLRETTLETIDTYLLYAEPEDPGKELSLLPALIAERLAYEAWYEHIYDTGMLDIVLASLADQELLPRVDAVIKR